MKYLSSQRWTNHLLILLPLLVSLACNFLPGKSATATPTSVKVTVPPDGTPTSMMVRIPSDVAFGPGPYNLTDMTTGLAALSSYKATLTYSFDGNRAGNAEQWSKTYVMLTTREPAAQQLTIETTGNSDPVADVFMAEANGTAYEHLGENACTARVIEPGNSFADWLEPAGMLTSVIGADEAGAETVNDVAADHYTFDERALGGSDVMQATGEMWVASEGGYLVKYQLTTKGDATYFGEGIDGTVTWDYALTNINQPVTFNLPKDCPPGLVNAPQLPDATHVLNMPGVLTYESASSLAEAAAFYQEQIPKLDWTLTGEPTLTDTMAFLSFTQGDQALTIIITQGEASTRIRIVLGKAQAQ